MIDASRTSRALPYAGPETPAPGVGRFVALVIVDALAALASLYFVALALHIWSCSAGPKWCHLQALVLGLPSGLAWFVLLVVTASVTATPRPAPDRSRALMVAAWLLVSFAGAALVGLLAAVVHNSR